jgi:hypothetical protein
MPLRVRCADSASAWVGVLAAAEILVLKPGTPRSMVADVCAGLVSAAGRWTMSKAAGEATPDGCSGS